jgi:hypothetical protein
LRRRRRWERKKRKDRVSGDKSVREKKILWDGLNGYRNKFRVLDTKHHKYEIGSRKKKVA